MKLNEFLFLIFWLFIGLLINHHIVGNESKIDISIGTVVDPAVYTITNIDELTDLSFDLHTNNEGRDSNAS